MLAAATIATALVTALFLVQHIRLIAGQRAARQVRPAVAVRPMRATLHHATSRTDWTKLESYDPLWLDDPRGVDALRRVRGSDPSVW